METVASLKRMMAQSRIVADIRNVLDQAGLSSIGDAVVATLACATTAVKGAPCADATPADGRLVECEFEPGGTLLWMAYRPQGRQKGPGLLQGVRWAGAKPFRAYLFRVTQDDRIYTFVLPKVCSNLSLAKVQEIPKPPAQISVDRTCAPDGTLQCRTVLRFPLPDREPRPVDRRRFGVVDAARCGGGELDLQHDTRSSVTDLNALNVILHVYFETPAAKAQ